MMDDATRRQLAAMEPSQSTWLSANAGSGKTRVLTNRVAKLLLGGTKPQNILCLTYTKAAAAEMQNRLFDRLGQWAMKDDAALIDELAQLAMDPADALPDLDRARTLFASAIETPGGLRIQTIHSFCGTMLRRFPLEARVSPLFKELDDRGAADIQAEAVRMMAEGADAALVAAVAVHNSDEDFSGLTRDIVSNRDAFSPKFEPSVVLNQFDVEPGFLDQDVLADCFNEVGVSTIRNAIAGLNQSDGNDFKAAKKLEPLNLNAPTLEDFLVLANVCLFGPTTKAPYTAKTGAFPKSTTQKTGAAYIAPLHDLMRKVEAARPHVLLQETIRRTLDLHAFAVAFLNQYEALKSARALLDFDDLIAKTEQLLTNEAVSAWVMYRLDGGIDHILVDESQDTSPRQWRVIRQLAQEFGHEGEDGRDRTIFVVGDKKQSIYSFQGADPREFDRMGAYFKDRLTQLGRGLQQMSLTHSFRSAPAILQVVDAVFDARDDAGFADATHVAFHHDLPGRVDLWDPQVGDGEKPEKDWWDATDMLAPEDDRIILARQIAAEIGRMVATEQIPGKDGAMRPVRFGDFLILVQRRKELFTEIIRACKALGHPIAGADQLVLFDEIAVKDLRSLLSFLALPQDSLALAEVLRSPLGGLDEAALFSLAHHRTSDDLWTELVRRQAEFPTVHGMLKDLRDKSDFLPPYELVERALTYWGGRQRLLARLGTEATEGIDAFLGLTQSYEAQAPASLTGFLAWIEADETKIKRQVEADGDKIRVMTTHGAKGLEAPIVIVPETQQRGEPSKSAIRLDANKLPYAPLPSGAGSAYQDEAKTFHQNARRQEELRLLYVAMTRAERWLIICGAGDKTDGENAWFKFVDEAMRGMGARRHGEMLRFETGNWPVAGQNPDIAGDVPLIGLPDWVRLAPPPDPEKPKRIKPSDAPGAKSLAGDDAVEAPEEAALFGTLVHAVLEHLADANDPVALAEYHARKLGLADPATSAARALAQANGVLAAPEMAHLFAPSAMAEVELTAPMPGGGANRIVGTADRVIVTDTDVLVVDFKSNAVVPLSPDQVPEGIIGQMALYGAALAQIYPNHQISAAMVWTSEPLYMPLPHKMVSMAAQRLTSA